MKNYSINIIILLLAYTTAFGQNQNHGLTRRQGIAQLDIAKGFGDFLFGTPSNFYKSFKIRPEPGEATSRYFSKVPGTQEGIKIDSVYLTFSSNKLYAITMYTNKSNASKLMDYCVKRYGPAWHDGDPDISIWPGRRKNLMFHEIGNSVIEINFSDRSLMSDADMADTVSSP